jgi:hypothetical protein
MPAQQALLLPEQPAQGPFACGEVRPGVCSGEDFPPFDLSALRLVPVPDVGPPFDGELQAGAPASLPPPAPAVVKSSDRSSALTCAAGTGRLESTGEWPQQFARLLAEALAGARPIRQILPWTSERARLHLHNLTPLFGGGQRPQVLRVIATRPAREVIEMTVIVRVGTRTRALAIRLERTQPPRQLAGHAMGGATDTRPADTPLRWVCTDIEAA